MFVREKHIRFYWQEFPEYDLVDSARKGKTLKHEEFPSRIQLHMYQSPERIVIKSSKKLRYNGRGEKAQIAA